MNVKLSSGIINASEASAAKPGAESQKHALQKKPAKRPTSDGELRNWIENIMTVRNATNCWEWAGHCSYKGYGIVSFKGKQTTAQRVSWQIWNGDIPRGLLVCHHCDNPPCVNPDHLWIGTPKQNTHDAMNKGRLSRLPRAWGESHGQHKLTEFQATEIFKSLASNKSLSIRFKVASPTIWKIKHKLIWKHIHEIESSGWHDEKEAKA